ncbi:MAG: imidazoleglycerol-phosphate dehydratase [Truepera sp.]|nr:imidazoleglycerol-phosphate dehydratase [Truepera sp.]
MRQASIERITQETTLRVELDLDAPVGGISETGHGFVDHLLAQLIRHGRFNLTIRGQGDLHVDVHHLAEDAGITLGQAFATALGERRGIERYADAWVPMDETLAQVVIDLSGRPYLAFEPYGYEGDCHGFIVPHLRELLRGFCNHAGATMHVRVIAGRETHHVSEAIVKAWARALYQATRLTSDTVPSTKGLI